MGWVINATRRPLHPLERQVTHCIARWVGATAGLDRCGKSRSPLGFDPRTVQPVASRYTEYATRSTMCNICHLLVPLLAPNNLLSVVLVRQTLILRSF